MTRDPIDVALGTPVEAIETPALLLDLDAFEANCRSISGHLRARGVASRACEGPSLARHRTPADGVRRDRRHGREGFRGRGDGRRRHPEHPRHHGTADHRAVAAAGTAAGRRRSDRAGRPPETGRARGRGGSGHGHLDPGRRRRRPRRRSLRSPARGTGTRAGASHCRDAGAAVGRDHRLRGAPPPDMAARGEGACHPGGAGRLDGHGRPLAGRRPDRWASSARAGPGRTRSAPTSPASANSRPEAAASWTSSTPRTATSTAWSSR